MLRLLVSQMLKGYQKRSYKKVKNWLSKASYDHTMSELLDPSRGRVYASPADQISPLTGLAVISLHLSSCHHGYRNDTNGTGDSGESGLERRAGLESEAGGRFREEAA